jgi:hypothetical protein
MARSDIRSWVALGLLAAACSLNPQPEPPAARNSSGSGDPDSAPPAEPSTGGTLSGTGGTNAQGGTSSQGATFGGGGVGPGGGMNQVEDATDANAPSYPSDGGPDGGDRDAASEATESD